MLQRLRAQDQVRLTEITSHVNVVRSDHKAINRAHRVEAGEDAEDNLATMSVRGHQEGERFVGHP